MGDENLIRTLGDYSRPSHEGYRNTIELLEWNNVVPLQSDTIRLVQNGCLFHELRFEDPNQHLKDFLKLVDSLDLDDPSPHERILLLISLLNSFHREGLQNINDPRDFAKPVKAISLPQDVPSTSDRRLINLENQFQRLMEAHLAPKQPIQVNKITSSCEICSGPHDTQYCMENPEQAFIDYASSHARLSKFEADFKQQQSEMTNKIDTILKAITDQITGALPSDTVKNPKLNVNSTSPVYSAQEEEQDEKDNPKNINTNPSSPPDPSVSFITEKVRKLNSFFESLSLVPQSPNKEFVCTKGDDGDMMLFEIIKKNDDSHKEEPEVGENARVGELEVEYFDVFPTRSELAYHKHRYTVSSLMDMAYWLLEQYGYIKNHKKIVKHGHKNQKSSKPKPESQAPVK
ncbi:hypothetical protein Tco_0543490, partial [Tanacetum coccineum]